MLSVHLGTSIVSIPCYTMLYRYYAEELQQLWIKARGQSLWQDLFVWFGEADAMEEELKKAARKQQKGTASKLNSDPPQTPPKGSKAGETVQQSKPKPSAPKRKAEDLIVTPVKTKGQVPESGDLGLKTPPDKSARPKGPKGTDFGKPKRNDSHLAKAKAPVVIDDPLALNEEDDDADIFAKLAIRRAKHRRVARKIPESDSKTRKNRLKKYLATLSLDWGEFQRCHKR